MSDVMPLSEVLSSEADERIIQEPETVDEVIETKAEETGEAEKSAEATTPVEETKTNDVSELEQIKRQLNASIAQANDERSKRQALQQQFEQKQVEKPDAYVEPDKAIAFEVDQVAQQNDQRFLAYAFENAQDKYPDFLEMQDIFFDQVAASNPALIEQAKQQADPYKFIYNQAKNFNEFKDVGSLDEYKSKVELELRAKLDAEYAEKLKQQTEQVITNSIPGTLSTATAAGGTGSKGYSGQTPLSKIFDN